MSNAKIPAQQYRAIAALFARVHNGSLSCDNVLILMNGTLGAQGEVDFNDLYEWRKLENKAVIESFATKNDITLNPTRLIRALKAIQFIKPTTSLCTDKNCLQYTVTDERGEWEEVQPGSSCPVNGCNEKVRKTEVVTHRHNWITGQKVVITQEFDREHGSEPVPLTDQGVKDYLFAEAKAEAEAAGEPIPDKNKLIHGFYAAVITQEGFKDVPEPYVRILNVLACHSEFTSKFPGGPKQIMQALVTPKAFGIGRNDMKTLGELAAQQWWVKGGVEKSGSKTLGVLMPRGCVLDRPPFYRWLRKCPQEIALQIKDVFSIQVPERATAEEIMSKIMSREASGLAIDLFRTISSQLPHLFSREVMEQICIPLERMPSVPGSRTPPCFNFNDHAMDWDRIAQLLTAKYSLPNVYVTYPFSQQLSFSASAVVERLTERYSNGQIAAMINEACGFETER